MFPLCGNDGTQDQGAESSKNNNRIFQVVFKFLVNPICIPNTTIISLFNASFDTGRHGIKHLEPAGDRGPFSRKERGNTIQIYSTIRSHCKTHDVSQFLSIRHKNGLSSPPLLPIDEKTDANTNHTALNVSLPCKGDHRCRSRDESGNRDGWGLDSCRPDPHII